MSTKPELVIVGTVERLTKTVLMSFILLWSLNELCFYDQRGRITVI